MQKYVAMTDGLIPVDLGSFETKDEAEKAADSRNDTADNWLFVLAADEVGPFTESLHKCVSELEGHSMTYILGEGAVNTFVHKFDETLTDENIEEIENSGVVCDASFKTKAELDAFAEGLHAGVGWLEYNQVLHDERERF